MSDEEIFLDDLALLRLETHFSADGAISAQSSFPSWLQTARRHVRSLHLLLPLQPAPRDQSGSTRFEPRPADRIYALPDCRGYLRAYFALPVILWRLIQVRRRVATLVVRAPEHLNAALLPLVWLLRFRIVLWLVHDRDEVLVAERSRRKLTPALRLGLAVSALTGYVERIFLKRVRVVANGSALLGKVQQLGADPARLCRVVSATLKQSDMPTSVARQRDPSARPIVLYVGRISVEKGLVDLLDAIPAIKERCAGLGTAMPRFKLVGWGAHGEEERLRSQAAALGLGDDVEFAGRVPFGQQLFEAYRSASVYVLPSWAEGTPRAIVEAMAFGLPVVATTVGGIPDVIEDGQNGLLVPPRNSAALAAAICELLTDDALAARMSEANAPKARELSVENVCRRFLSFVARAG
jgi:glycosyltransferase involved in cell wall biosynthesis